MYDSGTESRRSSGVKKAIDLYSVIEDILRHWLSILLLTAGVFICAFVFLSWRQQSSYASSATVAVTNANYTSNVDTYNMLSYMPDVTGKVKSILESKEFRDAVAADLGYSGFKGSETVSIVGDSNLIRITVRSGQPDVSYLEVKSILNNYKKLENNLSGGACFTVLEQPAIQAKPDLSASGAKKAALAALAVCALMCFALAGFSLCKDDIRDGFDVADKTGADFLGAIYRNGKFRTEPDVLITEPGAGQAYIEEIRRLATRISRKMTENGQKVLLVAGASGEEGKSAAAANLVAALRQSGKKVSLVSTTGAQGTGAGGASGSGQATGAGGASGSGQVIGAQVTCADIASRIEKLREEADFVIIDAAPLSESSDAVELAGAADTSVLIVRRHYCDTPQIRSAVSALGGPEKLLGIIVTDVRRYCAAVSVSECARRREIGTRSFGRAFGLGAGQAFGQASEKAFGLGAGQEPAQTYLVDRGDKNVIEIDLIPFLKDLMREVRRYCILLLAVMLLFGGVFYYFGGRKRSSGYTAYSTFTVEPAQAVIFPLTNQKNQAAALVGKMLPSMLSSDAMMSIVKEDLGYAQSERLPASISASVVTNTNLVKVSVSASDAQLAYDVLQSVLRRSTIITDAAIGTVQKTVVDESGVPERRGVSTGNGKKAAAAGLILGLIVGLAALVGKLVLRDTILTEDEISWKLKARSLGRIPWVSKKSPGKALTIEADDVPKNFAQSIRAVRCRVEEAAQTSGAKTFLVTSAIKSEGKTTAAVNLALALARNGHRVLLVDGDLRDPSAAKALGMEPGEAGLSDLLAGKCTAEQALVSYRGKKELKGLAGDSLASRAGDADRSGGDHAAQSSGDHASLAGDAAQSGGGHAAQPDGELIVLPGGAAVESPYELWSGQAAGKLFEKLRGHFDYIIVDAPQSAVVSETGLIAELADACLFLIRRDCARFDEICEGAETFEESDCRFLGCVMRS